MERDTRAQVQDLQLKIQAVAKALDALNDVLPEHAVSEENRFGYADQLRNLSKQLDIRTLERRRYWTQCVTQAAPNAKVNHRGITSWVCEQMKQNCTDEHMEQQFTQMLPHLIL